MAALLLPFAAATLAALFWYYGGALAARSTSQGLLGFLAQLLRYVPLAGPVSADLVIKLDQWLAHHLGVAFEQIFHRGVQFITGINQYLVLMAKTAVTWPLDLFNVLNYLVWHKIPQLVGLQTKPIAREAAQATATAEAAMKAAVGVAKSHPGAVSVKEITVIKKVTLPHAHNWDWINAHWKGLTRAVSLAATGAIATTIPVALPKDVPFGRTVAQIRRRLRGLSWLTAFAGAGALVVAGLARIGLSWIRCRNIGKAGKAICRMPTHWLENLLLGTLAIFGTISLRVFAKDVYDLTKDAAGQIQHFWRAELKGQAPNPGLGETGGPAFLNTSKSYTAPNPGLGEAA